MSTVYTDLTEAGWGKKPSSEVAEPCRWTPGSEEPRQGCDPFRRNSRLAGCTKRQDRVRKTLETHFGHLQSSENFQFVVFAESQRHRLETCWCLQHKVKFELAKISAYYFACCRSNRRAEFGNFSQSPLWLPHRSGGLQSSESLAEPSNKDAPQGVINSISENAVHWEMQDIQLVAELEKV